MENPFQFQDQQDQRRALSEDTVSYSIFLAPIAIAPRSDGSVIRGTHNAQERTVSLESLHIAKALISSIVSDLAKDYIWHKDAFSLRVVSGENKLVESQPYLKGETRFGDSLDDEWMIVFLLREISKRIPGSIVRVQDNDGEFLLIEAADYIPSWLDPDNSDNRVFIHDGDLHIIPIAVTADEKSTFPASVGSKSKSPKLLDALDMIRSSSDLDDYSTIEDEIRANDTTPHIRTLANLKIQQAAFGPLAMTTADSTRNFAEKKIHEQRHYARCRIPVDVARILKSRPEMITRACEAFYTRDTLAMATCSRMVKFLPTTTSGPAASEARKKVPFVTTAVSFTRTCYAQLMGQQFQPPKSWNGIFPSPGVDDPKDIKEAELGMKLTCGFEILCSPDYPGDFGYKGGEDIQMEDFPFATDYGWRMFKNNLTMRKYFGDERPGSKDYQEREQAAKKQFLEFKSDQLRDKASNPSQDTQLGTVSFHGHGYHPVDEIEKILSDPVPDFDSLVDTRAEDDDSWMEVDLQVLEDMMRSRGFGGAASAENHPSKSQGALDMQQMLDKFGEFIQEGKGGIDGAEFLDEQSDDDNDDDDDECDSEAAQDPKDGGPKPALTKEESEDEEQADDDDDDMFASDYEERQAKKQASKLRKQGGGYMFGSEMMSFDNGFAFPAEAGSSDKSEASKPLTGATTSAKSPQALALDHSMFKGILLNTFGISPSGTDRTANKKDSDNSDDDLDDQGLKEYMAELDAELSGTKVGQSFEKMAASSASTEPTKNSKEHKGKEVDRAPSFPAPSKKAPKMEKSVEDMLRESTARSRRGFSRQGPLPSSGGGNYGYDPASMALEEYDMDDEDDEDADVEMGPTQEAHITVLPSDDEEEDHQEASEVVDMDLNLAKNLLESFKSQGGLPGPGGNLLSRLGIMLPRDEESEEES
ncbi:hypothetical protein MVEG_01322 [Podila verticillata NRRL 6337]|nr:hypothetical protein MVEG_01322 [Podila verticillata NRRL 6337]